MSPPLSLTLGGVSSSSQCGWTPTFRFIKSACRFNPEGPLPSPARVDGRQAGRGGSKARRSSPSNRTKCRGGDLTGLPGP